MKGPEKVIMGSQLTHQETADMAEPARKILQQMEEESNRLTRGHYRLIVGDDASGRLFGIMLADVIGKIHEACGIEPPGLAFLVGHPKVEKAFVNKMTEVAIKRLRKLLETNIYSELGRKLPRPILCDLPDPQILVATDGIQSGSSLIPALKACEKYGVDVEAAAIRIFYKDYDPSKCVGDTTLYNGEGERSIYQRYSLLGVEKKLNFDTMAHRYKSDGRACDVVSARKDIDLISEKLFKWFGEKYLGKKESKRKK